MADLRVKLFLDLVNRTKAGAEAARRDLAGVKAAAEQLRRARTGDALRRDLARAAKEARVARDALAGTVMEGRKLARTGPGQVLRRDLAGAAKEAKLARRALAETATEAQKLARNGPGQTLRRDLAAAAREARFARQALAGTIAEGQRLARVGPGQALRRDLARIALEARRAKDELRGLNREASAPRRSGVRTPDKSKRTARGRNQEPPAEAARGDGVVAAGRGMIAAVGGYIAARATVRGTVGNSVSLEAAMADVKKKVDLPVGENWANLERTIVSNAIAYGRAREEVAGLVAEAGAAGVAYQDLARWTQLATRAAVAWDMTAQDSSQRLAETRAQNGWSIDQLSDYVDKINWLGDTSAAKEADIVEMFAKAGAAAEAANVPFDASLASLTALRSVGMRDDVAARFFEAFSSKLAIASTLPKKAAAGFKLLGTSAKQIQKAMKTDAVKAMVDILERLENSPDKAAAAVAIFGQEWWSEAARMGKAIPEMIRLMKGLNDPANWKGSSQKAIEIELSTTQSHLEKLKVLSSEVGDRLGRWALPGINKGIEELIALLKRADELAEKQAKGDYTPTEGQQKFNSFMNRIFYGEPLSQSVSEIRDAQEPLQEREAIESRRTSLAAEEEEARQTLEGYERLRARGRKPETPISQQRRERLRENLARKQKARQDFDIAIAERDEVNLQLAELEGARRRYANLRINKQPGRSPVGSGLTGFGPGGVAPQPNTLPPAAPPKPIFDVTRFNMVQGKRPGAFDLNGPKSPGSKPDTPSITPIDIRQWINPTVDLGPTIMQQLAASIDTGRGQVEGSARQAGEGIRAALAGVDLGSAGAQAMNSYAAGIAQGGERAVAEAQRVASRVRGAMAGVGAGGSVRGGGDLSGALHDGVTER